MNKIEAAKILGIYKNTLTNDIYGSNAEYPIIDEKINNLAALTGFHRSSWKITRYAQSTFVFPNRQLVIAKLATTDETLHFIKDRSNANRVAENLSFNIIPLWVKNLRKVIFQEYKIDKFYTNCRNDFAVLNKIYGFNFNDFCFDIDYPEFLNNFHWTLLPLYDILYIAVLRNLLIKMQDAVHNAFLTDYLLEKLNEN